MSSLQMLHNPGGGESDEEVTPASDHNWLINSVVTLREGDILPSFLELLNIVWV